MENNKIKDVYHIANKDGEKAIWTRIGIAFVNKDDSLNVLLNTIPLDGKIHIRDKISKKGDRNAQEM